ncbi:MAG: ACT domain-containing protein [Clostridiaceae bacterium]
MEGRVYARLDQGVDSFLRVATTLRRKEFNIKALNMISSEDSGVDMEVQLDNCERTVNDVVNVMLKLADVKEVRIS